MGDQTIGETVRKVLLTYWNAVSFQALYAGVSPRDALGAYGVIAYMDTISGVYFPKGGMRALPDALAAAAADVPVQTRSERPTSFDPADFGAPTGREVNWKHTPLDRIAALVTEYEAVGVVVGLPTSLKGRETASTAMARSFADALTTASPEVPVELVDERLTTVTAGAALHGAGRNTRKQRDVIDQAAAVVLLQAWIDSRHARR